MHNRNKVQFDEATADWADVAPEPLDQPFDAGLRGLRFPFDLSLRYRVGSGPNRIEGVGRTIDISNGGIRFLVDRPQTAGSRMDLYISWPEVVQGCAAVQLHVTGEIVRCQQREAVLRIHRHEFSTTSRGELSYCQ